MVPTTNTEHSFWYNICSTHTKLFWAVMENKAVFCIQAFIIEEAGDSSMPRIGYCKYTSSSHLNWSVTLAVIVFVPDVEDEAEYLW